MKIQIIKKYKDLQLGRIVEKNEIINTTAKRGNELISHEVAIMLEKIKVNIKEKEEDNN